MSKAPNEFVDSQEKVQTGAEARTNITQSNDPSSLKNLVDDLPTQTKQLNKKSISNQKIDSALAQTGINLSKDEPLATQNKPLLHQNSNKLHAKGDDKEEKEVPAEIKHSQTIIERVQPTLQSAELLTSHIPSTIKYQRGDEKIETSEANPLKVVPFYCVMNDLNFKEDEKTTQLSASRFNEEPQSPSQSSQKHSAVSNLHLISQEVYDCQFFPLFVVA